MSSTTGACNILYRWDLSITTQQLLYCESDISKLIIYDDKKKMKEKIWKFEADLKEIPIYMLFKKIHRILRNNDI